MPDTSDIIPQSLANYIDELPEGWTLFKLDELLSKIQYGYTASALRSSDGPRFLRITDIQDDVVNWDMVPSCEISEEEVLKFELIPGDIVFARTGATTGKSYLIKSCPKSVFASYLIRIRPKENVDSRFLYFFFHTPIYWRMISENLAGIAQPNCNASKLKTLEIPVPPLPEQHRIVAKVEELFKEVDAAHDRLNKVPVLLKHFRQAVLAAACSGRLTEGWRDENPDVEPANKLLQKIKSDVRGRKGNARKATNDFFEFDQFEVPHSWTWATTSDICLDITDGDHFPPPKNTKGVPFIVISNISSGIIDLKRTMFVSKEYFEKLANNKRPQYGDILYTVTGSYGIPVLVDTRKEFCFQRHIALLRPHQIIPSKFLWILMKSDIIYRQSTSIATGIAQLTVPLAGLRLLKIPLPPLEEQHEIVRRVEALFALADEIERQVVAATKRTNGLRQAILAKAFRGELVPTEAELGRKE